MVTTLQMTLSIMSQTSMNPRINDPIPKVSVHMITFNHKDFIKQALDSALTQETQFPFEIVVGEDCSSDGTREIVVSYANAYCGIVRALLPDRNLGRFGEVNFLNTLKSCRGTYIAFLEGDDFWTDPRKLQIQVAFLDDNPDIVGCFQNAIVVNQDGKEIFPEWFSENIRAHVGHKHRFDQHDCLLDLGSSYPSCGLMFRRSALHTLPQWYLQSPTDFATDILITKYGDLVYIPMNMGAYRIHQGGIWQGKTDLEKHLEQLHRYSLLQDAPELAGRCADTLRSMIRHKLIEVGGIAAIDYTNRTLGELTPEAQSAGSVRLFSVRHEFPAEWEKFQNQVSVPNQRYELTLTLREDHYPFWSHGCINKVKCIYLLARSIVANLEVADKADTTDCTAKKDPFDPIQSDLHIGQLTNVNLPEKPAEKLQLFLNSNSISELWITLTWGG
jgi:hypothetical protein